MGRKHRSRMAGDHSADRTIQTSRMSTGSMSIRRPAAPNMFQPKPNGSEASGVIIWPWCRFALNHENPSALSVALCLAQAMCPKDAWLAAYDIDHNWPMFGRPRALVTDSAKEFKGHAFRRGCEDYGIRIRFFNVVDLVNRLETEHRGGKQGRIADI
jgi:hypothetical protein